MQYFRLGFLFTAICLLSCIGFGQALPQLVIGKELIPFDSKYVVELTAEDKVVVTEKAQHPLREALEKGLTHLYGIDLKEALEKFKTVNLYFVHNGADAMGVGPFSGRIGSVYITETKSIYINTSTYFNRQKLAEALMTHEFLGALGYNDTNYQITAVLKSQNVLELTKKLERSKFDMDKVSRILTSPATKLNMNQFNKNGLMQKSGGGVTVIGGGGDEVLLEAKTFMLDYLSTWKKNFILLKKDKALRDHLLTLTSFNLDQLENNDALFEDYLSHFVTMPFEPLTYQTGLVSTPITSLDEVNTKAAGVFQNEFSRSYVRLSRDHWNQPIQEKTLQQSREIISFILHGKLFVDYLTTRHPR